MRHWSIEAAEKILRTPEVNVAIFAFLLNFVWEFWQAPFFGSLQALSHFEGVWLCTIATGGDVVITLCAYWAASASSGSRRWVLRPRWPAIAVYIGIGMVATILLEWLATGLLKRWAYSELMPTLHVIGTGLLPFLQWLILPPVTLWLARNQIVGLMHLRDKE